MNRKNESAGNKILRFGDGMLYYVSFGNTFCIHSILIGHQLGNNARKMARISGTLPKTISRNGIEEYGHKNEVSFIISLLSFSTHISGIKLMNKDINFV